MHRHFSNRGEALAEVTAARVLGARKYLAKSASSTQDGRRLTTQQWFSRPAEATHRPKINQAKQKEVETSQAFREAVLREAWACDRL
jgi:hypothetical protein